MDIVANEDYSISFIAVSGSDVYAAGKTLYNDVVWKNGIRLFA